MKILLQIIACSSFAIFSQGALEAGCHDPDTNF